MSTTTNLAEGIEQEINRCQDLIDVYRTIPTGAFGAMMIRLAVDRAIRATAEQDTVAMIRAYNELRSCQ